VATRAPISTPILDDQGGPLDGPLDGPFELPTPTILDEIADAVEAYPSTDVRLEIIDLDFPNDALNTGERGSFSVKVTNNGTLTMKNVRLKAVADSGTEVRATEDEDFAPDALAENTIGTIAGGGGSNSTTRFFFEAPNGTKPEGTVLVEVTIDSWDATWDFTLNKRSEASSDPVATFASAVVAS
jgi:uncharacterized repeat protein (TIGR01451 family)